MLHRLLHFMKGNTSSQGLLGLICYSLVLFFEDPFSVKLWTTLLVQRADQDRSLGCVLSIRTFWIEKNLMDFPLSWSEHFSPPPELGINIGNSTSDRKLRKPGLEGIISSQFLPYTRFLKHSIQIQYSHKQFKSTVCWSLNYFFVRKWLIQIEIILFAKKATISELLKTTEWNQFQEAGEFFIERDIFI